MRIAYAFRRGTFYPQDGGGQPRGIPTGTTRTRYLRKVKDIGFDGLELGFDSFAGMDSGESSFRELRRELDDAGTPCVAVRAGGGLSQPTIAAHNRERLEKTVKVAAWLGAEIVNTALAAPPRNRKLGATANGAPLQDGTSQLASEEDFVRTARVLHEVGETAGASGLNITVEVHQHSIADNSWSTLHLLELADSPYVFANPDLGNVYWAYDVPEEATEETIVALAPHSKYWHCKNLYRVHVPETEHAYFIKVPLPDGEIDYLFAISAMVDASYDGFLAVEGAGLGDQLHKDQRSFDYVKSILDEPR